MAEYIFATIPATNPCEPCNAKVGDVWVIGGDKHELIVRCRDCKHSHKDGTLCNFFASWVPIAGGDEYECMPVEVEPDGFCKWGEPKEDK